jgi:hypothetical protein
MQQSQLSQHHHWEAPDVYRGETRKHVTTENSVCNTISTIPNKIQERLQLLDLRSALHIQMQKAVILYTCHNVRKVLAEKCIRSALSVTQLLFWQWNKLLWNKENG